MRGGGGLDFFRVFSSAYGGVSWVGPGRVQAQNFRANVPRGKQRDLSREVWEVS